MEQFVINNLITDDGSGKKSNKALLFFLIALGLIISSYLLYRHHILVTNSISKIDVCSAVFGKGCDASLTSSVSNQFGLPLAAWGILYFITLFVTLLLPVLLGNVFEGPSKVATFLLTLFASLASASFLVYMLINPALFCPFCVVIHAINLVIFYLILQTTNFPFRSAYNKIIKSIKGSQPGQSNSFIKPLGYATIFLIVVSLYFGLQILTAAINVPANTAFNVKQNLSIFLQEPIKNIPIELDDPVWGIATTPVELIVFSDFQCPSCQYFSQIVDELKTKYRGQFHLVFKHFPLGRACNSVITENVHPKACEAAMAAEAAKQQGKFWEFHDSLFVTNLNRVDKSVCTLATEIGLDQKQFEQSRIGQKAYEKIVKTVQLANSLGVSGTPAVFLNGRNVKNFSLESMESLMNYELKTLKK